MACRLLDAMPTPEAMQRQLDHEEWTWYGSKFKYFLSFKKVHLKMLSAIDEHVVQATKF